MKGGGIVTERQERFCIEFVRCGNATEAYRCAGYKPNSAHAAEVRGSELLRNVEVRERIAQLREKMDSEKIMDAAERREVLTAIARNKGQEPQDRIRAIDTMNKMDGLYINKTQLAGADGGPLTIAWENGNG